jgi:hypothetical protein
MTRDAGELFRELSAQWQVSRTPGLGARQVFAGGAATVDVDAPGAHIAARQPECLGREAKPCHETDRHDQRVTLPV